MARTKKFDQEEVLEKAMNLFWGKGYHATSMQDLIDNLGINRASLYDTFGSKKELYFKALNKYKKMNAIEVADFLYYQTNIRQGLFLMFERQVERALNNGRPRSCFIANASSELAASSEKVAQIVNEDKFVFEEMFTNYLQYGINQSQLSPYKDVKGLSSFLYTLFYAIQGLSKINPNKADLLKAVTTGLTVLD